MCFESLSRVLDKFAARKERILELVLHLSYESSFVGGMFFEIFGVTHWAQESFSFDFIRFSTLVPEGLFQHVGSESMLSTLPSHWCFLVNIRCSLSWSVHYVIDWCY